MSSAQTRAVTDARNNSSLAPLDRLDLDFSGPCTLGGTAKVTGSYEGDGRSLVSAQDRHYLYTAGDERIAV